MNLYLEVLKKYAVFNGRARRKEYWVFFICNLMVIVVFAVISNLKLGMTGELALALLETLFFLAVFVPSIAVAVRRLHDTGRSGWWLLFGLIPIIGQVVLIAFLVLVSQPGENQYGLNPRKTTA